MAFLLDTQRETLARIFDGQDDLELIGKTYLTWDGELHTVIGVSDDGWYGVQDDSTIYIESAASILFWLGKQTEVMDSLHKQALQDDRDRDEDLQAQAEHDREWGFTNGLPPYRREKILKTLNRMVNYADGGVMMRKDFIYKQVTNGATVKFAGPNDYRLYLPGQRNFYDLTRTGFDFACYLLDEEAVQCSK